MHPYLKKMKLNWNVLEKCVGFMNMKRILDKLDIVSNESVEVPDLGKPVSKDPGEIATLPKRRSNKKLRKKDTTRNSRYHPLRHWTWDRIGHWGYLLCSSTNRQKIQTPI